MKSILRLEAIHHKYVDQIIFDGLNFSVEGKKITAITEKVVVVNQRYFR